MPAAAVSQPHTRKLVRLRIDWALLVLFASAGAVSVLKGLAPSVVDGSEYYWLLSYEHGFIKRGLIGTLFRPLLRFWSFDALAPAILTAHIVTCLWIIVAWCVLFGRAVRRESDVAVRMALALSFLCLMCSQMLPTLAHDVGYVDVYLVALTLGGFWLVLEKRYVAAALLAGVGPFVHEGFVFLWLPVSILLVWSAVSTRQERTEKLLAAALPALAAVVVIGLHSQSAVQLSIQEAPLDEQAKGPLFDIIFGQTVASAVTHMFRYDFRDDLPNFVTSIAYFLPPAAAMLWAAAFCYGRRWTAPLKTGFVAVAATLSPLAILVMAWDLSRFLAWSTVAAGLVLIATGSPRLVALKDAA